MKDKTIFLIVGETGSGKDSVVNALNMKKVISYTTRPKREGETNGVEHYFVSNKEMDKIEKQSNIFAWTKTGDIRYCATDKEVETSKIYIINPDGIRWCKENYKGNIKTIVIGITAPLKIRMERCKNRSDFSTAFKKRVAAEEEDYKKFKENTNFDYLINNVDLEKTIEVVKKIISLY